jgi:DNA-binding NarL/FixJ family response regulator
MLRHLVSLLETEFEVVGTAEDGKSALECIRRFAPDVAVLDLVMPVLNGIEVTREARKMAPKRDWSDFSRLRPAVVICSVEGDPDIIEAAKKAGALGYVLKIHADRDLITAVKSAAHGKWFVSAA